jgi:hypothetical protein
MAVPAISLRESRITTTPLFDCAQRSNRSQPYELALLLSPYGKIDDLRGHDSLPFKDLSKRR